MGAWGSSALPRECQAKTGNMTNRTRLHSQAFALILSMRACVCMLSHVQLFATPWSVAHQVPLSMGFPRQEYWSGLLFPSPGDLPEPGIEPMCPASPALAGRSFTTEPLRKPNSLHSSPLYQAPPKAGPEPQKAGILELTELELGIPGGFHA